MKRREFVRSAIALTLAPAAIKAQTGPPVSPGSKIVAPGPLPWMLGLDHVDDSPVEAFSSETIAVDESHLFTPLQMGTLIRLCDILMPPMMGHPGATECLTPAFLDFFISRSAPEAKTLYQTGLDMLESRALQGSGRSFAKLDAAQVDAIIRPFLVPWMKDHLPKDADMRFLNRVHYDIRMATKNSGKWALAQLRRGNPPPGGNLYWFPIEPDVAYRDTLPAGSPS